MKRRFKKNRKVEDANLLFDSSFHLPISLAPHQVGFSSELAIALIAERALAHFAPAFRAL